MIRNKIIAISLTIIMTSSIISCGTTASATDYLITEEGVESNMLNTPTTPAWFPNELIEWDKNNDKDYLYNKSIAPLNDRIDNEKLDQVNSTQNKDTKVVAISIMNSSTSGNPSQGRNKFDSNTFSYWQYIDKLVYWGGSAGEGLIVPPSPDVVDSAHKNGVPVLGTVFFPTIEHGGKMEWLNDFLKKDDQGNFVIIDKLIDVAKSYGFDGWFINQETQGTEQEPLTPEHSKLMQEFIKQFKSKVKDDLEIMWYDSMTSEGKIDWQNALTEQNEMFLVDGDKNEVSDSMFLNFWWTIKKYADQELLKLSEGNASKLSIDPKELYAGIDVQEKGTGTPIRWDLFEKSIDETFTSLGLYCPSWTYSSADSVDEFHEKESRLWVNEFKDPRKDTMAQNTEWRGISKYVMERSVVNTLPFKTNFNMGNGYNFFIDGEKVSSLDWSNRSLADIMPTYRWIIDNEGSNNLSATIDYANAFYGGNSIKLFGKMDSAKKSIIKLYSADLVLEKGTKYTTTAKSDSAVEMNLVLEFTDGGNVTIKGDKKLSSEWTTVNYNIKEYEEKTVKSISYELISESDSNNAAINIGNITIDDKDKSEVVKIKSVKVDDAQFEEEDTLAGVRLSWEETDKDVVYEIYRVNKDNSKSFLGSTLNNRFFVNSLQRDKNSDETKFEVVAVNNEGVRGKSSTVEISWPDNKVPKANFKSDKTVIAPGESVTFESTSNSVTEEVEWVFEGATVESSTDLKPVVKYEKEGIYTVKLKAKNKKGENEKVSEGLIMVTPNVADGLKNLSLGRTVEASSFVNDKEAPQFALDGKKDTKWCAVGPDKHNMTIDLGEIKTISEVRIEHAEAGGENSDMNTEEYKIEVSNNNIDFNTVAEVIKNSKGETIDAFKAIEGRYVKITILKPTQGSDSATRIYGVDVFGL